MNYMRREYYIMKVNESEQEFVLRYFRSDKLDTKQALQNVKARLGASSQSKSVFMLRYRRMAVAATLLILLAVGAYTLLQPKTITYASGSEIMACHLPDGTQVTLSPHSSISYQEDHCRSVEMKGCAYFQVKHDEEHPFDVNGERGHVRVLGTQFMVDERKAGTSMVLVTSGKVFFSSRDSKEGVFLTKDMQAQLLQGSKKPTMLGRCDVNDVAWATHRLHFDDTPLPEVLKELTKLSGVRYTASDNTKRLSGDFVTDSLPQVIQVIEETLEVSIVAH